MNKAMVFMIVVILLISCKKESVSNEKAEASFFKNVETYLLKKNIYLKDYQKVEVFRNVLLNEYKKEKCIISSVYEMEHCKKDVETQNEYKELLHKILTLPEIQQKTFLEQFKKEKCMISSVFKECSENLSINNENFNNIEDSQKIAVVELKNLCGAEWRYSKEVLIAIDEESSNVIGFWEKKSFR